jgi:hypothetical protein
MAKTKVETNLKSEKSQDYAQKPQQNCALMNSISGLEVGNGNDITERMEEMGLLFFTCVRVCVRGGGVSECEGSDATVLTSN